jgi:hypothetical protein
VSNCCTVIEKFPYGKEPFWLLIVAIASSLLHAAVACAAALLPFPKTGQPCNMFSRGGKRVGVGDGSFCLAHS